MSESQITSLTHLVKNALNMWGVETASTIELMNRAENLTFRVRVRGRQDLVLRLHREGYHSRQVIESEMAWSQALRSSTTVCTPRAYRGRDGHHVQSDSNGRMMSLFEFVPGRNPGPDHDFSTLFEKIGSIAATAHLHALHWKPPGNFRRPEWNLHSIFGRAAIWGDWRIAPAMSASAKRTLEEAERQVRERLTEYGKDACRYGLIHADMRMANLLVDGQAIRLIDFDDCGKGWFMYDFAATLSFMELESRVPSYLAAWLRGYRRVRPIPDSDEAIIPSLVMLRRFALLAWIASRRDATEAQTLAPGFADGTVQLAEAYLSDQQ